MAFRKVTDYLGHTSSVSPPEPQFRFQLEVATAGIVGAVYEFNAAGELVLATADDDEVAVIGMEAVDDGGLMRGTYVTPGAVYEVPLIGVLDAALVPGFDARIDATSLGVDAADITGDGALTIIRFLTDPAGDPDRAWVVFNSCMMVH